MNVYANLDIMERIAKFYLQILAQLMTQTISRLRDDAFILKLNICHFTRQKPIVQTINFQQVEDFLNL